MHHGAVAATCTDACGTILCPHCFLHRAQTVVSVRDDADVAADKDVICPRGHVCAGAFTPWLELGHGRREVAMPLCDACGRYDASRCCRMFSCRKCDFDVCGDCQAHMDIPGSHEEEEEEVAP